MEFAADEVDDELCAFLTAECGGVEAQVVILSGSPCGVGVEIVVVGALVVDLLDEFLCNLELHFFLVHHSANAILKIGGDKDVDVFRMVAQDVVGGTSDDDARVFAGKLLDDSALKGKNVFVGQLATVEVAAAKEGLHGVDELTYKAFSVEVVRVGVVEHAGAEACLFSCLGEDVFVVVGNVEMPGNGLAYKATGGAVMTAYGDDEWGATVHQFCVFFWRGEVYMVCSLR